MKTQITCKNCKKTETMQIDKKTEWWKINNYTCPDCYKKEQLERAVITTKNMELVQLVGSDKQINWATTIRASKIKDMQTALDNARVNLSAGKITHEPLRVIVTPYLFQIIDILQKFISNDDAKFWINNRNDEINDMIKQSFAIDDFNIVMSKYIIDNCKDTLQDKQVERMQRIYFTMLISEAD